MRPGTSHSPEVRARIAASNRARWQDPVYAARAHAARAEMMARPETRARMSAARRAHVAKNPDFLKPEQIDLLLEEIKSGATAAQVAKNWIVSVGYVRRLGYAHGLKFGGGRAPAPKGEGT